MAASTDINVKHAVITGSTTALEVVAAVTAKTINVLSMAITNKVADDYTFKSAGTAIAGPFCFGDTGGMVLGDPKENYHTWFKTEAGEALNLIAVTGNTVGGVVTYYEDD